MKKKIFISSVIMTGLLAVGAIGILPAYADDTPAYPPVVQKLADRFGLDVDDVQEVFDEERAEHHAQMLQSFEEILSQEVEDGKITEEQKQLILDKHEEMQAKMEEFKDLSPEERREKMDAWHDELRTWAQENNIEMPFFKMRFGSQKGFKGDAFEYRLN